MRYINLLLIHTQRVFEQRMRSFIWFLMTLINPIILILFWHGALEKTSGSIESWTKADFNSYYLMIMLASNLLVIHIEEHISLYDIQLGNLTSHLIRPFSYYWMMFYYEMPYRILQGTYGIIAAIFLSFIFKDISFFTPDMLSGAYVLTIIVLALLISFTFKVIVGLLAFWFVELDGVQDMLFVLSLIFGGYIVPLNFLPDVLKNFIFTTPFPWITYYPTIALLGKLSQTDMLVIVIQQLLILGALYLIYKLIWGNGIKKFTAVGQ